MKVKKETMKTRFSLLPLFAAFFVLIFSTSCVKQLDLLDQVYNNSIDLREEKKVPKFRPNTIIEGNVILKINDGNKPDLSPFGNVIEIRGYLQIGQGITDEDIALFSGLQKVQTLSVTNNDQLTDLRPLKELNITETIILSDLSELSILPQFMETQGLEGDFIIGGVPKLIIFDAFPNLVEVEGAFTISGNDGLQSISIPSLKKVFRLLVSGNPQLNAFTNIALDEVIASFELSNLPNMTSLEAFSSLQKTSSLKIEGNGKLQTLDGLQQLKEVNSVRIVLNTSLHDFCGIANAMQNPNLVSYTVFDNVANPNQEEIINDCL
jgi:hypothetical protein